MQALLILLLILVSTQESRAEGLSIGATVITNGPSNTAAVVGDQVTFKCTSDSKNINWYYGEIKLAEACQLNPAYSSTHSLLQEADGTCSLIIHSITVANAGVYRCEESSGFEQPQTAYLIVIDSVPSCTVTHPSPLNIRDPVTMTCTATYTPGYSQMLMRWTDPSGQTVPPVEDTSTPGSIVSYITFPASFPSVLPYTCTTYFNGSSKNRAASENTPSYTFVWNSSTINNVVCPITIDTFPTTLPNVFVGEDVTCSAGFGAHPEGTYEWTNQATGEKTKGAILRVTDPGSSTHSCTATVTISGAECYLSKTVNINASVAASCYKRKQANSNAPSGLYYITTARGQRIEVYCEMGLNDGGYTFLSSRSLVDLTDAEVQALFTDRSNFLLRTKRCDGFQYYGVLTQLSQYSYLSLVLGLNSAPSGYHLQPGNNAHPNRLDSPFLFYGFLPTNVTSSAYNRSLRVNGINVAYATSYTSTGPHHIILIPGFNEKMHINISSADFVFTTSLFSNTKPNPSGRAMPEEYFMFLELYWDYYGYGNTYGSAFTKLCVQTGAIGFR